MATYRVSDSLEECEKLTESVSKEKYDFLKENYKEIASILHKFLAPLENAGIFYNQSMLIEMLESIDFEWTIKTNKYDQRIFNLTWNAKFDASPEVEEVLTK